MLICNKIKYNYDLNYLIALYKFNLYSSQVTEDAVNEKAPPIYHYAVPEAVPEDNFSTDDETSSGSRAAAVGGDWKNYRI